LFEPWSKEREVKEKEAPVPDDPQGKKPLPVPGDPVDTRTLIYGILERSPRIPASDLARILRVDLATVYHYRKEYRGRISPGKESPEPLVNPSDDSQIPPENTGLTRSE
jgi:hypothetical protein